MPSIQFSGSIRPDVMTETIVLESTFTIIKFLEINGRSREARKIHKLLEQLEITVKQGSFKN